MRFVFATYGCKSVGDEAKNRGQSGLETVNGNAEVLLSSEVARKVDTRLSVKKDGFS